MREARTEADIEIREDKLEQRYHELPSLQERLGQKENEPAAYVTRGRRS